MPFDLLFRGLDHIMMMTTGRPGKPLPRLRHGSICALAFASLALAGCDRKEEETKPFVATVAVETARMSSDALHATGTGEVKARVETSLSFKASGRISARLVDVGDHVKAGALLATLDPAEREADIEAARAAVTAQEATLRLANSAMKRREALTRSGVLAQRELDAAEQQLRSAESDLASLKARLATAEVALAQTELRAEADGIITARHVEVGQVVQPSAPAFTLARDGDRDAVFNVQEVALSGNRPPVSIRVRLLSNPEIEANATLREVSPVIDRALGTVRVKLAISNPPPAMTLGAPIVAEVEVERRERIYVPWQALTASDGKPAVWVVDPKTRKTILRPLAVDRYDTTRAVLTGGLSPGEIFVVSGARFLREGQEVAFTQGGTP